MLLNDFVKHLEMKNNVAATIITYWWSRFWAAAALKTQGRRWLQLCLTGRRASKTFHLPPWIETTVKLLIFIGHRPRWAISFFVERRWSEV